MNLVGVFAAALIFICCNVLVARFYTRWDVTTEGLYTLSPASIETLERLEQPVEVVVFLSQSDPLTSSVRYMLDAYGGHSTQLTTRFVDPDRSPAEFVALQREYGLMEGRTENGRLASEASIVVASQGRRWYVTTDDIVAYDEQSGRQRPQLEQVLTEGIVNVLGRRSVKVCFTAGHGEEDVGGGGPQGLGEFRRSLERNNYEVRSVDLGAAGRAAGGQFVGAETQADGTKTPSMSPSLRSCDLVVAAGPTTPFSDSAANQLLGHVERGGNLLLAVGPVVDEQGRIVDVGLGKLTETLGLSFGRNVVFEQDPSLRMPIGLGGEVLLASVRNHPITKALVGRNDSRFQVLLQLAQGIQSDNAEATPVLVSSEQAVTLRSFAGLRTGDGDYLADASPPKEAILGAAVQFGPPERRARILLLGSASPMWSSTWREPGLLGTRRFVESAVGWLAAQPQLVSVPEKPEQPAGLRLTEESLGEVQRYVLLYMPITAALFGGLVLYRRRSGAAVQRPPTRDSGTSSSAQT